MDPEPLKQPARRAATHPRIPGYRVESLIGRGATGVVYKATQLAVDREVALKVLHPELATKKRTVHRLQREARTTARLAHPHIVSAIDMGEVNGRWWYAMELVDGPSLALRLRQEGRIREREALRLFIPLAEALVHTHEHAVVHRDIKPGNILLDRAGGARLADLGLAFADDDPLLTTADGTLGTPHYISPEQARDPTAADIRSDIWSLGATLFHTLCGRPPFAGASTAEVLSGVLYAAIPDPTSLEPELSRGLVLVLRKCLSRDPAKRYTTPSELVDDLELVRERRRPHVRESSLEPLAGRLAGWVPWTIGALVLIGMGLAGILLSVRPWEVTQAPEDYAPLEAVLDDIERESASLSELLARVLALEPVPIEHDASWRAARDGLHERLGDVLESVRMRADVTLSATLQERRFDSARLQLSNYLERDLLVRTGFGLANLPAGEFGVWLERRRAEVEGALRAELTLLGRALGDTLEDELDPEAQALLRSRRYRSAQALYDLRASELAAQAALNLEGLPEQERRALLIPVDQMLEERREASERAWEQEDSLLLAMVRELAAGVETQLTRGALDGPADEALEQLFAAGLSERGQLREELPLDPQPRCLDELARRARDLRDRQELIANRLDEGVHEIFDSLLEWLDETPAERLWAQRDYVLIAELYADYAMRARARWGVNDDPWARDLVAVLERRREEALRLESLMRRAAAGANALDRKRYGLRVNGVYRSGRLFADGNVLEQGFSLSTTDHRQEELELSLRELAHIEVERFAGYHTEDELLTPEEQLELALFRARCGDIDYVRNVLENEPLPEDASSQRFVRDLERRVAQDSDTEHALLRAADEQAQALLATLTEERVAAGRQEILPLLERLLGEFGDTPSVLAVTQNLVELRERLVDPDPDELGHTFENRFRPDELSFLDERRVGLRWDFPIFAEQATRWELGGWRVDVDGQRPPGVETGREDLLAPEQALRIQLREPLDVDQPLQLEIELQQDSDVARLCVISFAGFHIALTGPGLPGVEPWGVHANSISLEALFAELPRRVRSSGRELLSVGARVTLRVSAVPKKGELRVEVQRSDEGASTTVLDLKNLSTPRHRPAGSTWLELRAWEMLHVRQVRLIGRDAAR